MDSAREVAELLERLARAAPGLGEQLPNGLGIRLQLLLGHPEAHAERDEACLRAVVEVALDPAELGLLDVHRACAARLEPLDPMLTSPVDDCGVDAPRAAPAREPARSARSSRWS